MSKFKFLPKGTYKTRVTALIPGDMDTTEPVSFVATFKRLTTVEEANAFFDGVRARCRKDPKLNFDRELVRDALLGWEEMPGADGSDVPFSPENKDEIMGLNCYRAALVEKFVEDMKPLTETARKN